MPNLSLFLAILLFTSPVLAQISNLPDCALGCAQQAATQLGCDISDTDCICNTATFAPIVVDCSGTVSCSPDVQERISEILSDMCDAVASGSGSATVSASSGVQSISTGSNSDSATIVPPPLSISSLSTGPGPVSSPSATIPPPSSSNPAPSSSPSTGAAAKGKVVIAGGTGGALFAMIAAWLI
ncbi:hypothetical protein R3P38DRAFT_3341514 [Favolaschia claudopus]|uniref:CFEM domain-containing protein n=1 Tax=Favolaschia claudopus TaxID=2862362 RepID=A0AAW0E8E4_9AGAR